MSSRKVHFRSRIAEKDLKNGIISSKNLGEGCLHYHVNSATSAWWTRRWHVSSKRINVSLRKSTCGFNHQAGRQVPNLERAHERTHRDFRRRVMAWVVETPWNLDGEIGGGRQTRWCRQCQKRSSGRRKNGDGNRATIERLEKMVLYG